MTDRWVVVGAGSAGCVVAARLSEDPDRLVTLLEAGPGLASGEVPAAIDGQDYLSALDLPGRTFPDLRVRRSAGAAPVPYPSGRGVGGSSAVNGMVVMRGEPDRYRSWGWDDVDRAWDRVALPVERPTEDELGVVDRALLAAAPDAERARLTRHGGRRITSAEAYLWPALDRPNLTVRPDSPVDRVALEGRRAVGVVLADGTAIDADRVVLTAGAIRTPAVLLRSGVDAPGVGEGLQDHPSAAVTLHLARPHPEPTGLVSGAILNRSGIQVLSMNRVGASPATAGLGQLVVALLGPRGAAGGVALDADEPSGPPDVWFDLLDDPADLAGMRSGVAMLRELLDAPAFSSIVDAVTVDEHGTPLDALADDRAVDRWLRSSPGAYVHASSSCAMGRTVDGDGSVLGYERLYVCDASVFPTIPEANTHLPTTMLAERLVARW